MSIFEGLSKFPELQWLYFRKFSSFDRTLGEFPSLPQNGATVPDLARLGSDMKEYLRIGELIHIGLMAAEDASAFARATADRSSRQAILHSHSLSLARGPGALQLTLRPASGAGRRSEAGRQQQYFPRGARLRSCRGSAGCSRSDEATS